MVFDGNLKGGDVAKWLSGFQVKVNELAGSNYLKFTAKVWGKDKAVKVQKEDYFLYLDMEMYWSVHGELHFHIHLKVIE